MVKITEAQANREEIIDTRKLLYETWLDTYPNKELGITREDIEDHFKKSFSEEQIEKKIDFLKNKPDNRFIFIARDDDVVIGVCSVVIGDEVDELKSIYVLLQYQSKGVGLMLWNEANKKFSNSKPIKVMVASYNEKAINFYKKLGFTNTGNIAYDERFRFKSGSIIPETEMIKKN